jgi:hypothetical protein
MDESISFQAGDDSVGYNAGICINEKKGRMKR